MFDVADHVTRKPTTTTTTAEAAEAILGDIDADDHDDLDPFFDDDWLPC